MGAPQYEQAGADIGGTGTANTIPRWTGASTLGDSGLTDDGTTIKASRPTWILNVNGFRVSDGGTTNFARLSQSGAYSILDGLAPSGQVWIRTNAGATLAIAATDAGNVGIGTASPAAYASYTSLTIGDNAANKTGLLKLRSTYNAGNGAELLQLTTGVIYLNPNSASLGVALDPTNKYLDLTQTAGYGLKLPATPGNADTQTLDCYLDGGASGGATWTPVDNSGAGLALTVTSARYLRIGRLVVASFDITFPVTASVVQAKISLPVTAQAVWQGASIGFGPNVPGLTAAVNNADLNFWTYGAATTNATLSGARLIVSMSYFAN